MPASRLTAALGLALAPLSAGCQCTLFPRVDLQRMIDQERYQPYQATRYFPDGRVMRSPPFGTVPQNRGSADPAIETGLESGAYVTAFPVPVTRELLLRGRNRYDITCAPCHGITGEDDTVVSDNMSLRKPPLLVGQVASAFPAGRIYQVIHEGYGLMRSYDEDLPLMDRWAVVAYVRALQKSRGVALADLPPALRERLAKELP